MKHKAAITLLLFCAFALGCINTPPSEPEYGVVCAKNKCFNVELATTPEEHALGLMYRDRLAEGEGMLFILQRNSFFSIWMKNTLIPLDVVWIDENRRVVYIYKNMQPCGQGDCPSVNSGVPARYVLEVNAGTADTINLSTGDVMEFNIPA